tara:strand:- start:234 stop:389 length:156 start_codon:yes stop_codon:yes gene_type:complete
MNFANVIHKIFKIKLYNKNLYINPGFLCGLLIGSLVESARTIIFLKSLFNI